MSELLAVVVVCVFLWVLLTRLPAVPVPPPVDPPHIPQMQQIPQQLPAPAWADPVGVWQPVAA